MGRKKGAVGKRPFEICPHESAPLFRSYGEGQDIIKQLISEVTSGSMAVSEELRQYLRQAGLVNLWFFLKYICGFSGPYNEITDGIHLEMANWRQRPACMKPGARGAGFVPRSWMKDLACDTEIFTTKGWKNHGDVVKGDYVFNQYGEPVRVVGVSEKYSPEECLRISFQDGSSVVCGLGHLWRVIMKKRFRSRKHKVDFYRMYENVVRAEELQAGDNVGVLERPLQFKHRALPIDPYVLGVWLGDGTQANRNITQAFADEFVIREIENRGYDVCWKSAGSTKTTGRYTIGKGRRGHKEGFSHELSKLGLKERKHIPEEYFFGSVQQRFDLLRGLMDTDGCSDSSTGTAKFTNKSLELAEDVYKLASSLRLRPRLREHKAKFQGKTLSYWVVCFQHYQDLQPFLLPRKAKKAKKRYLKRNLRCVKDISLIRGVLTNCIQVEGNIYCVGKEFVPTHNSTIWSHGANTWEIVRDPDIKIRLESGIFDKAEEFLGNIKATFEGNELFLWLYPEHTLPSGWERTGNWSGRRIVTPARTRYMTEATVSIGSMTGASEGGHFTLYNSDDPVGLDDLDAQRNSSTDMYRKKNRFITNKTALLKKPKEDRIVLVGTRYAIDDIYDIAINDAYEFVGFREDYFEERPKGEWSIYNRCGEEDGVYPNPEVTNGDILEKALREDRWFAMTQLMNRPQKTGLAELNMFKPGSASMVWDKKQKDFVLRYDVDRNYEGEDEVEQAVWLSQCDVVMSIDPAGTDKGISAKTSRSSVGVWARDHRDRVTRIFSRVGYFDIYKLFDHIFEGHKQYPGYIRATVIEKNAMQKIILPILRKEEVERGIYINPQGKSESENKVARIRNALGMLLRKNALFLLEGCAKEFVEELQVFPMNEYKMDVLDESEKGITSTYTPMSKEAKIEMQFEDDEAAVAVMDSVFGY